MAKSASAEASGQKEAHDLWTLYKAFLERESAKPQRLSLALTYPSLTGHPRSPVSACLKQQLQVNLDVSNSCISSVAWEVDLIVALREIVSFLQLTLWGRVCSREKANIDSATAGLWG